MWIAEFCFCTSWGFWFWVETLKNGKRSFYFPCPPLSPSCLSFHLQFQRRKEEEVLGSSVLLQLLSPVEEEEEEENLKTTLKLSPRVYRSIAFFAFSIEGRRERERVSWWTDDGGSFLGGLGLIIDPMGRILINSHHHHNDAETILFLHFFLPWRTSKKGLSPLPFHLLNFHWGEESSWEQMRRNSADSSGGGQESPETLFEILFIVSSSWN